MLSAALARWTSEGNKKLLEKILKDALLNIIYKKSFTKLLLEVIYKTALYLKLDLFYFFLCCTGSLNTCTKSTDNELGRELSQ